MTDKFDCNILDEFEAQLRGIGAGIRGMLKAVYQRGFEEGVRSVSGEVTDEDGDEIVACGQMTQWEESQYRLRELALVSAELRDAHIQRLKALCAMNQNPECGGDDSIDETRWYKLREQLRSAGVITW